MSGGRAPAACSAPLVLLAALAPPGAALADSAPVHYMLQCQGCHLADGTGSPGAVPALRGVVGRFLQVPGGREYLIRVPGSAQSPLRDEELAEVLNWMVRRFGPAEIAADFLAFTADEVSRHRGRPLIDVEPVRRELLRQMQSTPPPNDP